MEAPKIEPPKLPDMVMCGDHPSVTKTELNVKEDRFEEKDKDKDKLKDKAPSSYARISPTSSRTERERTRTASEHALRGLEVRRRARPTDVASRHDDIAPVANRALVQAALGSFRWPPYLVVVWVVVLLLTHLLHCVVSMLERALPSLKKCCQYFRAWTEESWRGEATMNQRVYPVALALVTCALYAAYCALYATHAAALWAVEPLADDERREDVETRVTDYERPLDASDSAHKD